MKEQQPNIIFILSDDQGAWAMHCAGNSDVYTPSLDALAEKSLLFDNFFCASPVCSPARASILTGEIPSQHGVHDWLCSGNLSSETISKYKNEARFSAEKEETQYLANKLCYTDILAQNGYNCALSGKWHLGDSLHPQHGFSKWFTIGRGGTTYYHSDVIKNGQLIFTEDYLTDVITQNSLEFIDQLAAEAKPYYLSVHYTAPHGPWDEANHPDNQLCRYDDCKFTQTPDLPHHPWVIPSIKDGEFGLSREEKLRGYYAAITAMDNGIGKIIEKVKSLGQWDNTIIIFTSDNGMSMGHHGIWGKGNGTLPLNMYDSAVKVPFIFHAPNCQNGKVITSMHSHYDIIHTLTDYLGINYTLPNHLPGNSFASVLNGEDLSEEPIFVMDEYGPVRMIRTKAYKYIYRAPYGPDELFDLELDPDEGCNLIDHEDYSSIKIDLKSRLFKWYHKYADPAVDGTHEGVTGAGQACRAGIYANGAGPYRPR